MPAMKLKVRPVTRSQPPQRSSAARTPSVRGRRAVNQKSGDQQHQRGRQQPGDLTADLAVEEPADAGLAPHRRPVPPAAAAADGAGLVAGQAAEAVVAEGELEDRVVLRAADVGPARGRPQRHDRDPPAGGDDHRAERDQQVTDPREHLRLPGDQVRPAPNAGSTRKTCSILVRKPRPTRAPASAIQRTGWRTAVLDRAQHGVRRADQQQHEQRVGVVEAEHQHRHRRQRQHGAGEQAGPGRARRTPDRRGQQPDREDALERLRHQDRPRGQAEDLHRQRHRPQRERRLVDGDRVGGVGGAEEERLPRLGPGLRGRGVEAVGPAGGRQPPQVEDGGGDQQPGERRPVVVGPRSRRGDGLGPSWSRGRSAWCSCPPRCGGGLAGPRVRSVGLL